MDKDRSLINRPQSDTERLLNRAIPISHKGSEQITPKATNLSPVTPRPSQSGGPVFSAAEQIQIQVEAIKATLG